MNKLFASMARVITLCLCITMLFSSCKDETASVGMGANQGEMRFQFHRIKGWTVSSLTEIGSIKITVEQDGKQITLPSLTMSGTADSVVTEPIFMDAKPYKLVKYTAFDHLANAIFESTIEKNNEFVVEAGQSDLFVMPLVVYDKIDPNNIINTLHAICLEAFGEDRSLWPATWTKEHELGEWENLEFEYYEDETIAYIVALTLDAKFAPMKRLSSSIVNLPTIESLIIRDNALEELPENFGQSGVKVLQISNTNLSKLPESVAKMDLWGVLLMNNKFAEFPSELLSSTNMLDLTFVDEHTTEIPEGIASLTNLQSLKIQSTKITALPDVFDDLYRVAELRLSDNKNLTTLPSTLKALSYTNEAGVQQKSYLRSIRIDGCGFTDIPDEAISSKIISLDLSGNPMTELNKTKIEQFVNLEVLYMNDVQMNSFPALEMPSIKMISLINTGLTSIETAGLPNLADGYLLFTQQDYDDIFNPYEPNMFFK